MTYWHSIHAHCPRLICMLGMEQEQCGTAVISPETIMIFYNLLTVSGISFSVAHTTSLLQLLLVLLMLFDPWGTRRFSVQDVKKEVYISASPTRPQHWGKSLLKHRWAAWAVSYQTQVSHLICNTYTASNLPLWPLGMITSTKRTWVACSTHIWRELARLSKQTGLTLC